MILIAVLKINFLLAFEALVLIAALFLLLNVIKQEGSKWLKYGVYTIILFIVGIMICTIVSGCCCRAGNETCHEGGMKKIKIEREMKGHKMRMPGCQMGSSCCMEMRGSGCMAMKECNRMGGMSCCKGMEEGCEMENEGEDCCEKGMHGEGHGEKIKMDTVMIKKK